MGSRNCGRYDARSASSRAVEVAVTRLCFWLLTLPLLACGEPPPSLPRVSDRLELVLQPRRGWKAEAATREIVLRLISEKTVIRKGDPFGYRLELRNVGREAIVFRESAPSFIKAGNLCAGAYRFFASLPDGTTRPLACKPVSETGPELALELILRSGEYLRTRPAGLFRPLRTSFRFDSLGRYRIKVVYESADLRAESNAVELEVID